MRVSVLAAGVFAAAIISAASPMASAHERKVTCLCDCPNDHKIKERHAAVVVRRIVRPGYFYSYRVAPPVVVREWHGAWRVAPNDAMIGPVYYAPPPVAPPVAYGPPPAYYDPYAQVDPRGWTGGVGNGGEGGGGGGYGDNYGQLHFNNGGSVQNGPTYNDYNQSFQYNPSAPAPFQNRLMGGIAPTK